MNYYSVIFQTPGPGAHTINPPDTNKNRAPIYSMTGRNGMPGDTTTKPGPGAHSPERVCHLYDFFKNLKHIPPVFIYHTNGYFLTRYETCKKYQ